MILIKLIDRIQRRYWKTAYRAKAFLFIGEDTVLDNRIAFSGEKYISIGKKVYIGSDSAIQCFDRYLDSQYMPELIIGDRTSFTRRVTVYCAKSIHIGENCLLEAIF